MQSLIRHIIIELYQCPQDKLDDLPAMETLLVDVAQVMNTEAIANLSHQFQPYGVTAVLIVGASHLSIHTWPEHAYATLDMVVCTDGFDVQMIVELVKSSLMAKSVNFIEFRRGLITESEPIAEHPGE